LKNRVKRVLIDVANTHKLVDLCTELVKYKVEIVVTSKECFNILKANLIPVKYISELTGVLDIVGGRINALNTFTMAGITYDRNDTYHLDHISNNNILGFDAVIVNFNDTDLHIDAMLFDIQKVALLKAAISNYRYVIPIPEIQHYDKFLSFIKWNLDMSYYIRGRFASFALDTIIKHNEAVRGELNRYLLNEGYGKE